MCVSVNLTITVQKYTIQKTWGIPHTLDSLWYMQVHSNVHMNDAIACRLSKQFCQYSTQSEYIGWYQGVDWTIIMHPRCNEWHTASLSIYWRLQSRLAYSFNDECPPAINIHWEAHGRYNEPLVSKSNAFLDFVQLAGQLQVSKWNESGFRPPLCTYRLNWARRTSWGWWDDWDDTVLQTQDSKYKPWRFEAEHATSRSRRLPTILTFTRGWGRNIFSFFQTAEIGNRSELQHINWINWTLLSWACSRITAAGTCSNSWWGTVSKADDQWMYWCPAPVGCIIIGINFLGIFGLPREWMLLVWAVDRMWYCG